jgi:hypothetical protein
MKEVHRLESASQADMIENLQDQLAVKSEVKRYMANSKTTTDSCIRNAAATDRIEILHLTIIQLGG